MHPSELPEKVMIENHNFYSEFRVKVLKTFSGVIGDNLWGICPFFLLKMPHTLRIVAVALHVAFCLLKEEQYAYFIMTKSFLCLPKMKMAEVAQMDHAFKAKVPVLQIYVFTY